jgi:hypothetical protein
MLFRHGNIGGVIGNSEDIVLLARYGNPGQFCDIGMVSPVLKATQSTNYSQKNFVFKFIIIKRFKEILFEIMQDKNNICSDLLVV